PKTLGIQTVRGGKRPGAGRKAAAGESFEAARRRKESALASLRELELRRRRGKLVEVREVRAAHFSIARVIRDSFQNAPARFGPELAARHGIKDSFPFIVDLEQVIRTVLTEVAQTLDQKTAPKTEPAQADMAAHGA